jgi:hypothetical protein
MSFGIVTSLKFSTFEAPPENVLFYYPYYWNQTQARAGWDAWQQYCGGFTTPQIPAELNIRWVIEMIDGLLIFLLGKNRISLFLCPRPLTSQGAYLTLHLALWLNSYPNLLTEGAYHGSEDDFLAAIAPLLDALNAIGGLVPVAGYGAHLVGWLDSILYANNNDLITGVDSGQPLATPLNYTEVRLHPQIWPYPTNIF